MKANKISKALMRDYRRNIRKAYAFRFFRNLHFFSAVMIPFFTLWGKISFTQIMLLQAIFTFSIFLLEVPTGVIADKFGRKTSLILAGVVGFIAPLVYVSYSSFWVFAFAEFLWAVGAALVSGADSALIYDSLKAIGDEKESKKVFARYGNAGLVGILVAAPIGSLIAHFFGVRGPMFFTAFPMLAAVFIALSFKEPEIKEKKAKEGYFETFANGLKYLAGHKKLRILVFDYVPTAVLAFFMIWVYQIVLTSYNVPIGWFGFIHMGLVVSQIALLHYVTHVEKIFGGKKNFLRYSSLIVGALFLVLAFVRNLYVSIGCFLLIAAFGMTRKNIYTSYLNKFIESHNRATVLSTVSMIYSVVMAINNVILGRIVEWNLKVGLIIVGLAVILFTVLSRIEEEHLID